jgi:hypothetical protein
LLAALDELILLTTRGTPVSALRWTLNSTYQLVTALRAKAYLVLGGAGATSAAPDVPLVAGAGGDPGGSMSGLVCVCWDVGPSFLGGRPGGSTSVGRFPLVRSPGEGGAQFLER